MTKAPVIHQTDLFHPHNDPDDHWDLACQFALAWSDRIDLKGILIDAPEPSWGDPSIQSIHQLNHITGLSVPVAVGTKERGLPEPHTIDLKQPGSGGVNMVLRILEESRDPVTVHIAGSCRDIAAACRLNPTLFREKCRSIYLNAGTSDPRSNTEYNVALDPGSYQAVFSAPCPVYWMPCFASYKKQNRYDFKVEKHGTFYRFQTGDILPMLSDRLQKYFLYALGKVSDQRWYSYLNSKKNTTMLQDFCERPRFMWCTAGFFHSAGFTVSTDGDIVPQGGQAANPVFDFIPIEARCDDKGIVDWKLAEEGSSRYLFRVLNLERYQDAMTRAMRDLLMELP